ncbi:hypothetical protein EU245_04010 [Lentibacillus lipolyticus]|nr:hypothetical protein EU245_04010 [Lentibacillus lipolyticus]
MKKRYIASAAGAIGVGVATYLLSQRNGKSDNSDKDGSLESTLMDAGIPDQVEVRDTAQLENAKMVSEGSQFGVDYYNKVKESE